MMTLILNCSNGGYIKCNLVFLCRVSSQYQSYKKQWETANHLVNVLQSVRILVFVLFPILAFTSLIFTRKKNKFYHALFKSFFPPLFFFFILFYINLFCSQKRKSEDLNGEATNGQPEVKKEEDTVEEVKLFQMHVSDI